MVIVPTTNSYYKVYWYPFLHPSFVGTLTSPHTNKGYYDEHVRVHDHCVLRSLIGRKGRVSPSSLHTRRRRHETPKNLAWMISLHSRLEIMFHDQAHLQEVDVMQIPTNNTSGMV